MRARNAGRIPSLSGELREARAALDIARMMSLLTPARFQLIDDMADRVGAMLWRLLQRYKT